LVLIGAVIATVMAPPAHAGLFSLSEQDEIKAGQQMRQEAYKEYGRPLPASDPRQRRVQRIGRLFAAQAERRNIPFTYEVLQNDQVLNAFAGPGGPVFVTTKLISVVGNDSELAFVLGHETGHIERRHIAKSVEKQQKVGLAAGLLGALLSKGSSGNVIGAVTNVTYTLWQRGFSRDQERDADDYGVHAMSRLGFNPEAAVTMLGKLGSGSRGVDKYLATHPDPISRQGRMRDVIQRDNLVAVAQRAGGGRFRADADSSDNYYAANPGPGYQNVTNPIDYDSRNGEQAQLNAPLKIVEQGGYRVVMAPVHALAIWAGGDTSRDGDVMTVRRGNSYIVLYAGSDQANLNGRQVRLSAATRSMDGRLYAPLGSVVAGLGGQASYDASRNAVRVDFDGGRSGYFPL
jgi:Zn-dependent protease with chaperone function